MDFICPEALVGQLKSSQRDEVIAELVAALKDAGAIGKNNCKSLTEAVIKRENEASTGIGKGVAVPHVKHKAFKNVVATIGVSDVGIDFASLDKQQVFSVILIISPADDADKHLQAMESIFAHLQDEDFRKFLRQSKTPEQIKDLLIETDEDASS